MHLSQNSDFHVNPQFNFTFSKLEIILLIFSLGIFQGNSLTEDSVVFLDPIILRSLLYIYL